ncbi:MAG: type III pantothenate kinase [Muribaculaceae bacterium]|nr:type III pantothenate kinase [Muribaculaceae bacterium]
MNRIFTVDIGNTAAKGSVFDDFRPVATRIVDNAADPDSLLELARLYNVDGVAFCSVGSTVSDFGSRLRSMLSLPVVELTSDTPLPFEIVYGSPRTLGVDRIAAAAGAIHKYGGDVLVVDAGTAVTIDLINPRGFMGGNISPGLRLRVRSLNAFTAKLPLVRPDGDMPRRGSDTETAIRCGVVGGLVSEIAGEYFETQNDFPGIRLVMTGGDADFLRPLLEKKGVKVEIDHDLVGLGLVSIYNYNRK